MLLNDTDKIVITEELKPLEIVPCKIFNDKSILRKESLAVTETAFYTPDTHESGFAFVFSKNTACLPRLRIKGRKGQKGAEKGRRGKI
jgi:hypothetical protein